MEAEHEQDETVEDAIAAEMSAEAPDDAEPDDDNEPEPEPEPQGEPELDTEAVLEARGKKFDALTKSVARRTGEILGDDMGLVTECPLCSYYNMPGWLPQIEHPADLQAHVLATFGQHTQTEYVKDGYSRACDKCNGLGVTLSGSKVTGLETLPCFDCQGKGWVAVGPERQSLEDKMRNGSTPAPIGMVSGELPPLTEDVPEPPEVAVLKQQGYTVIRPFVNTG